MSKENPLSTVLDDYVDALAEIKADRDILRTQRIELLDALVKAVESVRAWHGMGVPNAQEPELWRIYWENSPEMKPIRELLEKYAKAEVTRPT